MRDLKFIAWDKRAKQMYQVENLGVGTAPHQKVAESYHQPNTGYNKFYPAEVIVMQYTGFKDNHGDEIYEGHILRYDNPEYKLSHETPYVIKWNEEEARFECVNKTNFMLPSVWKDMEIVGNVFENPELVDEK